jgi:hypothetical protein
MYYQIFPYHLIYTFWLYMKNWNFWCGRLFIMVVSLYVKSFMEKFPLKLIFLSHFLTLQCLWHIVTNLKCTPIDNWIFDMCINFTTLWQFRMLSTFNCTFPLKKPSPNIYKGTLKMCCGQKCQIVTPFCLHSTMETPSRIFAIIV